MDDHRERPLRGASRDVAREVVKHRGELAGMDHGMRVLSYLIAGVLVYGALGWLGDHYFGTGFLLPIGIVLGAAGGCYVIIRRYGQIPGPEVATAPHAGAPRLAAGTHKTTEDIG